MDSLVQKIQPSKSTSFAIKTNSKSFLQTNLHQHSEYELILFTSGNGVAWIGDSERKFETGDIFFIGSNLPHAFKSSTTIPARMVMILFRDNCWGTHFLEMPECKSIQELLKIATQGLEIKGNSQCRIRHLVKALETATDINRLIKLLQCLEILSTTKEYFVLTKNKPHKWMPADIDAIEMACEFTRSCFHERISLTHVAELACMSLTGFCHYFKRRTNRTYIDFLNEVRIDFACKQLRETKKSVTDIGYESGYNTVPYFHRQFLKIKKITPLQYRKTYSIVEF